MPANIAAAVAAFPSFIFPSFPRWMIPGDEVGGSLIRPGEASSLSISTLFDGTIGMICDGPGV
jgi:hypothetical protein